MIVGVLGTGQLARMLAWAAAPLGITLRVIGPDAATCAAQFSQHVVADLGDATALSDFARGTEVVTFETESIPVSSLQLVAQRTCVHPNPRVVELFQDRVLEKRTFAKLGIPTVEYRSARSLDELRAAVNELGYPVVVKCRKGGYDGKGQYRIGGPGDVEEAWAALGESELVVEQFVSFVREVALIAVRSLSGDVRAYQAVESVHEAGILRHAVVIDEPRLQRQLELFATRVLEDLDYVGVVGFEFFETEEGLLANEVAPRVHNTGHWTIEGAATSQFENHLRAILGLPLGTVRTLGHVACINYLGAVPSMEAALGIVGAHHHDYGKSPKPGRKLGHMTLVCETHDELMRALAEARELVERL